MYKILKDIFHDDIFQYTLGTDVMPDVDSKLKDFYLKHIVLDIDDIIEISQKTINQNNNHWKFESRKRIRAGDAYTLYTGMKALNTDWTKQATACLNPSTVNKVISAYEKLNQCRVQRVGLVINRNRPWLGCSTDGYVRELEKVIVIQSPLLENKKPLIEVLKSLSCFDKDGNIVKGGFYAEAQLSLAVLNAKSCIPSFTVNFQINFTLPQFSQIIIILKILFQH